MQTMGHGLDGLHGHPVWTGAAVVALLLALYALGLVIYSVLLPLTG
jgi:hypothetical protein